MGVGGGGPASEEEGRRGCGALATAEEEARPRGPCPPLPQAQLPPAAGRRCRVLQQLARDSARPRAVQLHRHATAPLCGRHVRVERAPGHERDDGAQHGSGGDGKPQRPPHVLLWENEGGEGRQVAWSCARPWKTSACMHGAACPHCSADRGRASSLASLRVPSPARPRTCTHTMTVTASRLPMLTKK